MAFAEVRKANFNRVIHLGILLINKLTPSIMLLGANIKQIENCFAD